MVTRKKVDLNFRDDHKKEGRNFPFCACVVANTSTYCTELYGDTMRHYTPKNFSMLNCSNTALYILHTLVQFFCQQFLDYFSEIFGLRSVQYYLKLNQRLFKPPESDWWKAGNISLSIIILKDSSPFKALVVGGLIWHSVVVAMVCLWELKAYLQSTPPNLAAGLSQGG